MSEKRRGLGRGIGALIPTAPSPTAARPIDVFFESAATPEQGAGNLAPLDDSSPVTALTSDNGSKSSAAADMPGNELAGQPVDLVEVPGAEFADVPLDSIVANPRQPRLVFDEDELAELSASIGEIGVLQPVVVRAIPTGDPRLEGTVRFELVMGERRLRASALAGLESIPAIVRSTSDDNLLRDALLENLHRVQLNPLEEAAAYQQLLEDFGGTHDELAGRLARSRPQISNTLRLLKLPALVQRRVAAGVLSAGHARALLGLPDGAAMERLAQRVVAEGLSVRATEEAVALGDEAAEPELRRRKRTGSHDEQLARLATRLSDRLDTRVKVTMGQRRGRITVDFATLEDLERILVSVAPGERVSDEVTSGERASADAEPGE